MHGLSNRPFRCMEAGIFFFMGKQIEWEKTFLGWNGIPGVYAIAMKNIDNKQIILYIGQSADIGKRLLNPNHFYIQLYQQDYPVYILFIELPDKKKRLIIEKRMIRKYKPLFNIHHNG